MKMGSIMNNGKIEVQIISAPWCKRCHIVKPEVAKFCGMNGVVLTEVDYEEMEEAEKETVKSLPTIRMRVSPSPWSAYTADTLEAWKTDIVKLSPVDTDF
jgi:thiol-disulfide isomerase/thioredoxin